MGVFKNLWSALWGTSSTTTEEQYLPLEGNNQLDALRWYYENNATYDRLASVLQGATDAPTLKGIRGLGNPAHRVGEFYAAKLIPQDLMDDYEGPENLKALIEKIDKWSNWSQRQRVASRWDAVFGNLFIKVSSSEDNTRVYRQLLEAKTITYFEKDERDFFTYLRIDTPQQRRLEDGEFESYTYTEVYDKEKLSYDAWEHDEGADAELKDIKEKGRRVVRQTLATGPTVDENGNRGEFTGFDFIPVVHTKFRDIGNPWGLGAFSHVLEAIDSLNLALTRLDNMLFPNVHLALRANAMTPEGQPIDAPIIDSALAESITEGGIEIVDVKGTKLWRLPGLTTFESIVPPIDFGSHLSAVDQKLSHLEKDLPELAYYRLRDMQEISGRAARILLGDLIDRVREARENFLAGYIRTNEMALTIAKVIGIQEFQSVGEFQAGALEHSFKERDIFPISELEKAEAEKAQAEADEVKARVYGIPQSQLREEAGIEGTTPTGPGDVVLDNTNEDVATRIAQRLGEANGTP